MYNVCIIGAGVVGSLIARELSKYQVKVCVLEKENDVAMGATKANSAIVHAGFDAEEGSLKAKLNVLGSKLMPKLARTLGVEYINNGSMVIGFDNNDFQSLKTLYARGKANRVKKLKILPYKKAKKLEPNLSPLVSHVLYAKTGAITCPYQLTIAAMGNAMDNGVELIRNFLVKEIKQTLNGYQIISSDNKVVSAEYVINSAGLFADDIAKMVGDNSFSITPRKGEYLLLDKECGNTVKHTIFKTPTKMGKGILVSPTVDGNLLLGPTSENVNDKENLSITAKGINLVLTEAHQNVQNLQTNKVITSFCGLRATTSENDFIINTPKPRFINVAGIDSPGLSSSPAIAIMVANLLKNQGLTLTKKSNFNPYRKPLNFFKKLSDRQKNKIIKSDPNYGSIVCRCEQVSLGEIINAIRQNPIPLDLDGVKRRTRAQMGRCQGGFCSPTIIELLAKELNVSNLEISKKGSGSNILVCKTKE